MIATFFSRTLTTKTAPPLAVLACMACRRFVYHCSIRASFGRQRLFLHQGLGRKESLIHKVLPSITSVGPRSNFTSGFKTTSMSSDGGSNAVDPARDPQENNGQSPESNTLTSDSNEAPKQTKRKEGEFASKRHANNDSKAQGKKKQKFYRRSQSDEEISKQEPHEGSYASLSMRETFGVNLKEPPQLLARDAGEKASNGAPREGIAKSGDSGENDQNSGEESTVRLPKRKVALLLAFVGEEYSGFQVNPSKKTVQAHVELALYQAGLLSSSNFGFPNKYQWSSSARTDKGVHACAQVCSVKIQYPPDWDTDQIRIAINEQLPSDIRVLDVVRTTRNFCARVQRDHVRYQYMLPTFLLHDRPALWTLMESHKCHENDLHPSDPLTDEQVDLLRKEFVKFRVDQDRVDRLRNALSTYVGTHLFHNFTKGKASDDASSQRYILSFDMRDPVLLEDGTEWIVTSVTGQSFLLHQIRKMISLAVDVARGAAEPCAVEQAMAEGPMRLSVAPAQGLFLDMSFFGRYNKKKKTNDNLDWSCTPPTPAMQRWKEFKESVVEKHIVKEEAREGNFIKYLFLQEYVFEHEKHYKLEPKHQGGASDTPER